MDQARKDHWKQILVASGRAMDDADFEMAVQAYEAQRELEMVDSIIVVDLPKTSRRFPRRLWRDAINSFLAGVWSDNEVETSRTVLSFGGIDLVLQAGEYGGADEYRVYGSSTLLRLTEHREHLGERLVVGTSRAEVTDGLARFVRNNRIRELSITVTGTTRSLRFLKMSRRGQLLVDIVEFPRTNGNYDDY